MELLERHHGIVGAAIKRLRISIDILDLHEDAEQAAIEGFLRGVLSWEPGHGKKMTSWVWTWTWGSVAWAVHKELDARGGKYVDGVIHWRPTVSLDEPAMASTDGEEPRTVGEEVASHDGPADPLERHEDLVAGVVQWITTSPRKAKAGAPSQRATQRKRLRDLATMLGLEEPQ